MWEMVDAVPISMFRFILIFLMIEAVPISKES